MKTTGSVLRRRNGRRASSPAELGNSLAEGANDGLISKTQGMIEATRLKTAEISWRRRRFSPWRWLPTQLDLS
jgi:hypothetical protein